MRSERRRLPTISLLLLAIGAAVLSAACTSGPSPLPRDDDGPTGSESRPDEDHGGTVLQFVGQAAAVESTVAGLEFSTEPWETTVWLEFDCPEPECGGTIEVEGVTPRVPLSHIDGAWTWTWEEARDPLASGRVFGCFLRVPLAITRAGALRTAASDSLGPTEVELDWARTWTLSEPGRPEWQRCESSVHVSFRGEFSRVRP